MTMNNEAIRILQHIFNARIDNAANHNEVFFWCLVQDMVRCVLTNNIESLRQYDYLDTKEGKMNELHYLFEDQETGEIFYVDAPGDEDDALYLAEIYFSEPTLIAVHDEETYQENDFLDVYS